MAENQVSEEEGVYSAEESAEYTEEEAWADAERLTCGEFVEQYPKETLIAQLSYDDWEPEEAL